MTFKVFMHFLNYNGIKYYAFKSESNKHLKKLKGFSTFLASSVKSSIVFQKCH